MTSERRANDNDPKAKGYELGDLEIVPSRRTSGTQAPVMPPAAPATPSTAKSTGARTPRNLTLADGDMGPALELDTGATPAALRVSAPERRAEPPRPPTGGGRTASAQGLPAVASSQSAAAALDYGTVNALDDFDQGFAQLPQIEVEKVERRSGDRVVAREQPPVDDEREKQRAEYEAVKALARFNAVPVGIIASVSYAFHVTSRVISLRRERTAALEQQRLRAREHHEALVALGQALLSKAADKRLEGLRSKIAHVQDERAKLERADQGVERTREGNQRALDLMRSEAEHLKEELEPYLAAERDALAVQRKADEDVRRAQAMHKRVEIELRALETAASADEARFDALNAQLEQRAQGVQAASGVLAQANEALGKARRDLALKRGTLDENEEKQKRLQAESKAREAEAEGQKQAANGAYEAALCELSEQARKQKLDALAPEAAAKVKTSEQALEAAGMTVVRFDRALMMYDRKAVIRGFAIVAVVIAAAVTALILR